LADYFFIIQANKGYPFMLALIERDPDLYLDEIQDELYSQHGVDVSLATIWRTF
jgi:hypothetical protein